MILEVVYTNEDGTESVRYRRPFPSREADEFIIQVESLQKRYPDTPYSYRILEL